MGEVTLRRPEDPRSPARLAPWGDPEHWASSALLEWASAGLGSLTGPIVTAVEKALAAAE